MRTKKNNHPALRDISTERHAYWSADEARKATVHESYEGWFVEFYENDKLMERRNLFEHNEEYAENAAENWVLGVIKG